MFAAVFEPNQGIVLIEREIPSFGPDEALLRVEACGICGTDLRILHSGHRRLDANTPRILGHELSGTIVEVGSKVQGVERDTRVAVAPNMGCGQCDLCVSGYTQICPDYISFGVGLDGGFSEYMLIPAKTIQQGNIARLPDTISFDEAALLEPLACCYHGLSACRLSPGETCLVYGAGPIGIMHMQLAKAMGASKVFSATSHSERIEQFPHPIADAIVDPSQEHFQAQLLELNNGKGIDVIIIATPAAKAQLQALQIAKVHGRINLFSGLPKDSCITTIDSNLIHYKELTVTGTTGQTNRDFRACLEMVSVGRIKLAELITHRYPLPQIHSALDAAREKYGLKVLVKPQQNESQVPS